MKSNGNMTFKEFLAAFGAPLVDAPARLIELYTKPKPFHDWLMQVMLTTIIVVSVVGFALAFIFGAKP